MAETARYIDPNQFYSRGRRVRDAFRFIRDRARLSSEAMERTKAAQVAKTYGVEVELIKKMKARFRNELSFANGGK